ncbi:MAG: RNA 2',3'-cyclic phosphodiesterase [Candidatus Micrarchaeaceae archaeon]
MLTKIMLDVWQSLMLKRVGSLPRIGETMEKMRCFICIDLPDNIKGLLANAVANIKGNVKAVEASKMHITLAFMGSITKREEEKAQQALAKLNARAFEIGIFGIKEFASGNRYIIFADINKGKEELIKLSMEVRNGLDAFGLNYDKKAFVPHITLARAKGEYSIENVSNNFGRFVCNEIKIKQSILSSNGPTYFDIFSTKLKE